MNLHIIPSQRSQVLPGNGGSLASFFVIRTLNMSFALLTKFYVPNTILLTVGNIIQQISITYLSCVMETLYLLNSNFAFSPPLSLWNSPSYSSFL